MAVETTEPPPTLRVLDGLANTMLERMVAAALIHRPDMLHAYADPDFGIDRLVDFHAIAVVTAIANLIERKASIDIKTVETELVQAGHANLGWYPALCKQCPDVIQPEWFRRSTSHLVFLAAKRNGAVNGHNVVEAEIDEFALRDVDDTPKPKPPWFRGIDLAAEIRSRAADPWVDLALGPERLARVRSGSTVVITGGSGSGKSSLTSCLLLEHAKNIGPAIALSIELPADELGARIVGIRCDVSWEDALCARVMPQEMDRALDEPRLFVLDRRRATLKNLEKCVDAARSEYPGEPILAAIDYAQLLDSKERDARMKVADAFAQIDDCARERRFVALALSQMSRASAQKARKGEAIGAESADLGAETAAIERFATLTLSIGLATEREDGSSAVELSVGKARMGRGDKVFPMTYWGRSGLWRVNGDARAATEVREERASERASKENDTIDAAIAHIVASSAIPLTRSDIKGKITGRGARVTAAINRLLAAADGVLVEVQRRAPGAKKRDWMIWTSERAREAGLQLVSELPNWGGS